MSIIHGICTCAYVCYIVDVLSKSISLNECYGVFEFTSVFIRSVIHEEYECVHTCECYACNMHIHMCMSVVCMQICVYM